MVAAAPKAPEELPDAAEARGDCLESYRVDVTGRAWPILVPAAMLTSIGAFVICTSFVAQGVLMHRPELTYFGAFCMLTGPVLAVYGMRGLLSVDEWVAVLERGLLVHLGGADQFMPWTNLARVRWDAASRAIVLEPREGDDVHLVRPFARTTNEKLAARLEELRRKSSFHLKP